MIINMEPCHKFISNGSIDQIFYICEEAKEAQEAALNLNWDAADMEVMDVIQSCITYFAIKGYKQATVDELATKMHKKNNRRGYYVRKVR